MTEIPAPVNRLVGHLVCPNPYFNKDGITIYHGDCLEVINQLPSNSIDMVLTDPPYGTTACKWDSVIPFATMWSSLKRVCKREAAVVMTASQPFTSRLAMSNIENFRYCWVWDKMIPSGFNYARFQPMRRHEDILVFYDKRPAYISEGEKYDRPIRYKMAHSPSESSHMTHSRAGEFSVATHKKKQSILQFKKIRNGLHPTQKPVELMEYLIKTYTGEGNVVLDFTLGSGTSAIAALRTSRKLIGIEIEEKYCRVAVDRLWRECAFGHLPNNHYTAKRTP